MQANYRFRFDAEHLIQSTRRYQQKRAFTWIVFVFRCLAAAFCAALAWFCFLIRENWVASLAVAGVLSMLFTWPVQKLVIRYTMRKSPFCNEDLTVKFDPEGAQVKGTIQDTRVTWAVYTRALRFKDGMLLFQGPHVYSWMPDAAAADSTSVASLRELAKRYVRDYREV